MVCLQEDIPDSKVHGANMGPIWGRQDPGGPQAGHVNFAAWDDWSGKAAYLGAPLTSSMG